MVKARLRDLGVGQMASGGKRCIPFRKVSEEPAMVFCFLRVVIVGDSEWGIL